MTTAEDKTTLPDARLHEQDYRRIEETLCESALGRQFLDEYVRRHAAPDTDTLLRAIGRLETTLATQASALVRPVGALRASGELRTVAASVRNEMRRAAETLGTGEADGDPALTPLKTAVVGEGVALREAIRRLKVLRLRLGTEGVESPELDGALDEIGRLSERHVGITHTVDIALDGLGRLLDTIGEEGDAGQPSAPSPEDSPAKEEPDDEGGIVIVRTKTGACPPEFDSENGEPETGKASG